MPGSVDFVFLDIGGVLYDDRIYAEAWRRALREAGGAFADEDFDQEYAACRTAQDRSFRRHLADRFVGADADLDLLEELAARHWYYPPSALHADTSARHGLGLRLFFERCRPGKAHPSSLSPAPSFVDLAAF